MLSPIQVQPQLHLTSYVLKAVALRGYSECSFWSGPKQVSGRNAGGKESVLASRSRWVRSTKLFLVKILVDI